MLICLGLQRESPIFVGSKYAQEEEIIRCTGTQEENRLLPSMSGTYAVVEMTSEDSTTMAIFSMAYDTHSDPYFCLTLI